MSFNKTKLRKLLLSPYCILYIALGVSVSKNCKELIATFKRQGSGKNRSYMRREHENITKCIVYVLNDSMRETLQNVYKIIGGSQTLTSKTQT